MDSKICKRCNGLKVWYGPGEGVYEYMLKKECQHEFD